MQNEETGHDAMMRAIAIWMRKLNDYPGWKEWQHGKIHHVLNFDDPFLIDKQEIESEFKFSDEIEKQHTVVMQYLGLHSTITALKECEFYFRRYPFRGLPISRSNHITNVCEMYFTRFYEFKERVKNYLNALNDAMPEKSIDIGAFVKLFQKVFDQELRERNKIHHHQRFDDIVVNRISLGELFLIENEYKGWEKEHLRDYRQYTKEWVERVRRRGAKMDQFLEAIADTTLKNCNFLVS